MMNHGDSSLLCSATSLRLYVRDIVVTDCKHSYTTQLIQLVYVNHSKHL